MGEPLTVRQEEILHFIGRHAVEKGYPPTVREIGDHFGIRSTNGVHDHLRALERKGWIERDVYKARAIRILGEELADV